MGWRWLGEPQVVWAGGRVVVHHPLTFAKGVWDRTQDAQGSTRPGTGVAGVPMGVLSVWVLSSRLYAEANCASPKVSCTAVPKLTFSISLVLFIFALLLFSQALRQEGSLAQLCRGRSRSRRVWSDWPRASWRDGELEGGPRSPWSLCRVWTALSHQGAGVLSLSVFQRH